MEAQLFFFEGKVNNVRGDVISAILFTTQLGRASGCAVRYWINVELFRFYVATGEMEEQPSSVQLVDSQSF